MNGGKQRKQGVPSGVISSRFYWVHAIAGSIANGVRNG